MAALKPFADILQNELTCSICQEIFTDPKALSCLHSFCSKCIADWYKRSGNQVTKRFNCPLCKTRIEVPDGHVSKLRSSFHLDALLHLLHAMKTKCKQETPKEVSKCDSCEKSLALVAFCQKCNALICTDCVDAHKTLKHLRTEHHITMLDEFKQENIHTFIKNQMLCKEKFHDNNKLEYYCQEDTCRRCICQKYFALSHQNHRMQSLQEAAEEAKQHILQNTNRVKQLKENYKEELEQSKKNMERIRNEIDLASKEVDAAVEMICKMVREHGRAIKNELKQTLEEQTIANDQEQTDINTGIKNMSEFEVHCETLMERSVEYEIIESKKVLQERCEILLETRSILKNKPIQRDMTIHYVTNQQVIKGLRDFGKVKKSVTEPSLCTVESLKGFRPGFTNTFHITTKNREGKVCQTRIESIDVKIKNEENEVEKKVFEDECGKYRVTYKPEKAGPYEIAVNIGGEPIKNSPQNVNILDVKELFKPVKTFGQFSWARSIEVSDNGEIAIVDFGTDHSIQIFSLDGKCLRKFGIEGTAEGKLFEPLGVIFNEDRIIVNDMPDDKGRIQEFDLNGTYVRTIYGPMEGVLPRGMCVNDDKNIAVCCMGRKELGIKPSIKLFSKQGDLIQQFYMVDKYELPWYITYGNSKYFVSYFNKNCISVYNKNGDFLYKFDVPGIVKGSMFFVRGLAVYGADMILVCDRDNNHVQLLTQEGQFIRSFGSRGSGVGQMEIPVDLVVTADGHVLVLGFGGSRVHVWI